MALENGYRGKKVFAGLTPHARCYANMLQEKYCIGIAATKLQTTYSQFPTCLSAVKTKGMSEEESVRGITTPPVLDLKLKPGFSLPGILWRNL